MKELIFSCDNWNKESEDDRVDGAIFDTTQRLNYGMKKYTIGSQTSI